MGGGGGGTSPPPQKKKRTRPVIGCDSFLLCGPCFQSFILFFFSLFLSSLSLSLSFLAARRTMAPVRGQRRRRDGSPTAIHSWAAIGRFVGSFIHSLVGFIPEPPPPHHPPPHHPLTIDRLHGTDRSTSRSDLKIDL